MYSYCVNWSNYLPSYQSASFKVWLAARVIDILSSLKSCDGVLLFRESLEDRLKYANEVMDEVIDSARNPLLVR